MPEATMHSPFFEQNICGDGSLILVVDDDRVQREMLSEALGAVGYRSVSAADGDEALTQFATHSPRMVILDVVMDGMDGFEVCRRLRAMEGGELVPVLMLTSLDDEEAIRNAFNSGATDFLAKPVNGMLLGYRVCHILREHAAVNLLHRSEYQQLTVFDSIPDPLLIYDRQLELTWANQAAADCFGSPREDLLGRKAYSLWAGLDEEPAESQTRKCFATGSVITGQKSTPDGNLWGIRIFPIRGRSGEVEQVVEMAHNITDKVLLQQDTIRNSQLASLGELAAGVAHEINNPISGVINYAQILLNRNNISVDDSDLIKRIQREGMRISKIVKALLNMARIDRDEYALVEIATILDDSLSLFENRLHKDGIILRVDLPRSLPPVRANKQQLQQVVINLISNARYALNNKQFGDMERKLLEVSAEAMHFNDREMIAIHTFDRGCGIPKHVIGRIMHPFFTTKPPGQGTGLGLSISHNIVREHGGLLTVDSEENEYTRVTMLLPVARTEREIAN